MFGLVFENRGSRGANAPFTVEELFAGRCLVAFSYREVWPNNKWSLVETESKDHWPQFEKNHPFIRAARLNWLKESLGTDHADNHQTFLVNVKNYLYFVMFHDGYIFVGDTARGPS